MPTTTLGQLAVEVLEWLEESSSLDSRVKAALNDGIESYWTTLMKANVSLFMGGPMQLSIATETQGVILVSIADPTAALALSNTAAQDAGLAAHTVQAAFTYVTESGTETMLSDIAQLTTGLGMLCSVAPPDLVSGAYGWNLYARTGVLPGRLVRQNDVPLQFATTLNADYVEPESGFLNDPALPGPPTENTTGDDICYIRHLECQMPDLGWKSYDATDIHSLLMRRVARNVATSSEYQTFYWDLINQRQLEFRPTTALAWNPRYFYIKRPRRLIYDNATLPFLTVPSLAFLRYYALGRVSLSIREFESAKSWTALAEIERNNAELAVVMMNHPRSEYITPGI